MPLLSERLDYGGPKKGGRLIRYSSNSEKAVTFSDHPVYRHAHIWSGYMSAGSALIDAACGGESTERHFLIYPILFCYRHGLEIAMKGIVSCYGRYADVAAPEPDHDLWQLWKLCRSVIATIAVAKDGSDAMAIVEKCVKEFHDLDKSGQTFRYSVTRNETFIRLPDGPIDLFNLREVMESLNYYLSGIDDHLDVLTAGW